MIDSTEVVPLPLHPIEPPFTTIERERMRYGLVPAECKALLPEDIATQVLVPEPFAASEHLMPMMVDTQACPPLRSRALFARLADDTAQGEPCGVPLWIESSVDAEAMTRQWRRIQLWPAGARIMWLRTFDPRVLLHLPRVLGRARWQSLHTGLPTGLLETRCSSP